MLKKKKNWQKEQLIKNGKLASFFKSLIILTNLENSYELKINKNFGALRYIYIYNLIVTTFNNGGEEYES